MLGIDSLDLVFTVADSGLIDATVNDLLARSQYLLVGDNGMVNSSIKSHLVKWQEQMKTRLTKVCETERFTRELELYQEVIYWDEETFFNNVADLVKNLEWHSTFYMDARHLIEDENNFCNPMFPYYFCNQWYQSLLNAIKQAQMTELEENKEKLLDDLYQRMETLNDIQAVDGEADDVKIGRLWNMASAKLSKSDVSAMKKHADFLKKHQGIREIAEQLGRMADEVADDGQSIQTEILKLVEEKSDMATDDIVGIQRGDDLNRLLPNETLFLSHPELEVVFYKNLVDKRLMNYHAQGKTRKLRKVASTKVAVENQPIEKGPFIVCIDASGSMRGFPEQSAKALGYALMQIALAENRDCYVMIFSTQMITYELTKRDGLREASDFLSYTFNGGTDLEPALLKALSLMNSERYKNADLIVLSDFMAPKQSKSILEQVDALKQKNNRFHAVNLSKYGNPQLMAMFDHCWSYHPSLMGRLFKKE